MCQIGKYGNRVFIPRALLDSVICIAAFCIVADDTKRMSTRAIAIAQAAQAPKARTLTNLYNTRPQWLSDAQAAFDQTVAAAYGWTPDISSDDALAELLHMNLRDGRA